MEKEKNTRDRAEAAIEPDTATRLKTAPLNLDEASNLILAYARQERENAIEAAQLHIELLASAKVPNLALKYSNYLPPVAKRELLKQLKMGMSKAMGIWVTLGGGVVHLSERGRETWQKLSTPLKAAAIVAAVIAAYYIVEYFLGLMIGLITASVALFYAGGIAFVRNLLDRRTPDLITNGVALETASQGDKTEMKNRLRLALLRHHVSTVDELLDEMWAVFSSEEW